MFVDVHLVFPRLPRLLKLCWIVTHPWLQHRESPTRGCQRVLGRQLSPRFEPFLLGTLCTSLKLRPVVSVANKAYSV